MTPEERYRVLQREVAEHLQHWQRLLLHDCVDDLDAYLDAPGPSRLREDVAAVVVWQLTFPVHGVDALSGSAWRARFAG